MKILHCLSQLPNKTGSGIAFTNIFLEMQRNGFENAVLYATQGFNESDIPEVLKKIKAFVVNFSSEELPFPIPGMSDVMPYEATVYSKMSEEMFTMWIQAFRKKLLEAKEKFYPDIIIAHHFFILTGLINEIFCDKKIIAIGHGTDIRQIQQNFWIKEKYISQLENIFHFCLVTPKDREALKNIFGVGFYAIEKKASVIGGGYDENIFACENKKKDASKIRIVYSGKIAKSKGVFELAKASKNILEKYPEVEFAIVGNASEETKNILRASSGNNARLKFLPFFPSQKDLASEYQRCHIYVLPSYYEALGLSVIEALACGMRAVTTEIEGLKNLLTDEAERLGAIEYVSLPTLQNVDEPVDAELPAFVKRLEEKIIVQIERVKQNPQADKKVLSLVKNFTWKNIAQKIIALF